MNTQEIKSVIAVKHGMSNLSFNFVRQFDERTLKAGENNIPVQDPSDAKKTIAVSYDAANPDTKYKVVTPWLSHWDNNARIRVVLHQDVMATIKANPSVNTLALKDEEVKPADMSKQSYSRYVIITPNNIELSF